MFYNYIKIAWRNLQKNRTYSLINILGLSIGMAVALIISFWIVDEISYNRSFVNHKQLAQVMVNQSDKGITYTGETVAMPIGEALKTSHGDQIKHVSLSSHNNGFILVTGDKKISRSGRWVQPEFTEMFTPKMIAGDRNALKDPSSILIAQSVAEDLFGNQTALDKIIRVDNRQDLKIAGVFQDFPRNSMFYETRLLLPWENNNNNHFNNAMSNWENHCGQAFIEMNEGVKLKALNEIVKTIPTAHIKDWKEEIMLQPIDQVYLYNQFDNGKASGGRIDFVRLMTLIAVFVLLLACINFMNLSTARSEKRAKEVGIRKAVGSLRKQLIGQFLGESVITAFLAFLLAIVMVQISLPYFNTIADKQMVIEWSNPWFWLICLGFVLFTGIIAGSYPAFYLSSFEPIRVLKGVHRVGRLASLPRKVLVVLQFTVSIALIIGTIVVFRQVQYSKSRPVGYNREGLLTFPLTTDLYGKYSTLRNELLQTGVIDNVAESSQSTAYFNNNNGIEWRGKDPKLIIFFRDVNVTHEFGSTVGWEVKTGRDFSTEYATDSSAAIINEEGASVMGFSNPVGEVIKYGGKDYTIVGVVKNMITQSPYEPMAPSVFFCSGWMGVVNARIKPTVSVGDALTKIAPVFNKLSPNAPFEYKFVDDEYATKFAAEERIGNLTGLFAGLAIFISCLGLFGLASFIAERRVKEIGVRKVLGASVWNLWSLLSKEFVLLVFISFFVAIPIAYFYMNNWLQDYNYRATLSWWIFASAGIGALIITLITISYQAIKTAIGNPVKSLRTE